MKEGKTKMKQATRTKGATNKEGNNKARNVLYIER
jgi:hypothetical protein